jgi:hypothetical protein
MACDPPRASRLISAAFLLAIVGFTGTSALAQDATPSPMDVVVLNGDAPVQSEGRIAANVASGTFNQQAGTLVIANAGAAMEASTVRQDSSGSPAGDRATLAIISGGSFAGSHGAISVNVAAGSANQEANVAIIATGLEGLTASDPLLSQTRSSAQPDGGPVEPASPNDVASLAPDAFAGSQGLIQVNLIGGERNSSANTFALNVSAGGNP